MLYRPKEGKGQGAAGWSATLQDFRQNTSFASKEYPDMGTEFGSKRGAVVESFFVSFRAS